MANPEDIYTSQPPYSEAEIAWLKEHCGGEDAFLEAASLDKDDEDDRVLGRYIMRSIKDDILPRAQALTASGEAPGPIPSVKEIVRNMAADLDAVHFDELEHEFLDEEFGGYENFMKAQGLQLSKTEHLMKAKELVRSMMGDSSGDDAEDDAEDGLEVSDNDATAPARQQN